MAGERDDKELNIPDVLGILPLRGTVVFPQAVTPLAVGRPAGHRPSPAVFVRRAVQLAVLFGQA